MNALLDNQLWENQNQLTASRNVQVRFYTDWPIPVSRPVRFFLLLTALLYRRRMADNKKWFKIWTTILTDPHLFTIPLEDFARWFILGALMASHGNNGKITVSKKQLCNLFRSDNDNDMKNSLNNMPNITWSNDNATITVIMERWFKYQVDSTGYDRLKKTRKKQNDNGTRREEKRREKKRIYNTNKDEYDFEFEEFWKEYPKKIGKGAVFVSWKKLGKVRPPLVDLLNAIGKQRKSLQWNQDNGKYIPNPSTWLNQRRWEDEPMMIKEADDWKG